MSRISAPLPRKAWYRVLYIQVLIAVALGIFVGHYRTVIGRGVVWSGILGADLVWPDVKHTLKPLGDGFIKLVKMMIAPIIFCTVVHGIASKGASGATGAGFVTLAATLAAVPSIPIASLALLVGIDRFMSECRALTNFIGNGVATMAISRWEKEVTSETLRKNLRNPPSLEPAAEPAQLR